MSERHFPAAKEERAFRIGWELAWRCATKMFEELVNDCHTKKEILKRLRNKKLEENVN
jgi:hypothetical protein